MLSVTGCLLGLGTLPECTKGQDYELAADVIMRHCLMRQGKEALWVESRVDGLQSLANLLRSFRLHPFQSVCFFHWNGLFFRKIHVW